MKSFGNFHHDVTTVLQNYFHYCALKMSCVELARTFVFLANQGKAIHIDEPVVTPMQARQINALMATSGMYQNAGSLPGGWDYRQNLALVAVLWRLFRMKWPSQSGVRNWMMPVTRLRALPSLNN